MEDTPAFPGADLRTKRTDIYNFFILIGLIGGDHHACLCLPLADRQLWAAKEPLLQMFPLLSRWEGDE